MNSNNDFFKFIQDLRKGLTKWLIIINPALVAFFVLIFNVDIVSKVLQVFAFSSEITSELQKSPRVLVTLNTVLFTVIANIIVNLFKTPGEIKIKLTNNSRKNNHHINSDALHRNSSVHLDGSIEFKQPLLEWIFLKFLSLKIQVEIPKWIDFSVVNLDSVSHYIEDNSSRKHFVNVNKLCEEIKNKNREFYIHYNLTSNTIHQNKDIINITLISSKKVLILVALFFDVKLENYTIELRKE